MTFRLPQARNAAEALAILRAGLGVPAGEVAQALRETGKQIRASTKRKGTRKSAVDAFAEQLQAAGIEPVRELEFARAVGRKWRFDFAWPSLMVAVEIDGLVPRYVKKRSTKGKQYTVLEAGGRHATMDGYEEDCRKLATAAQLGWFAIRFNQNLVRNGEALKFTQQLLHARELVPL